MKTGLKLIFGALYLFLAFGAALNFFFKSSDIAPAEFKSMTYADQRHPRFASGKILLKADQNFAEALQLALIESPPGSVIEMPEGHFRLDNEISIAKPFVTLRGQGKGKTILDFKGQSAGKQGIFATSDGVTLEDFSVLDTDGNGVKVTGSNGVTIRRIEMKWTNGPDTQNGAYAIYPVSTQNLLIEGCEVSGASDSGIYVGQSKNVIVRNNLAYGNVAGIEIENTQNADVYDNTAINNTAGILVFDLPNLNLRQGGQIRIYNNAITKNNLANFAPPGNIVGSVAKGIGILIVATKNIEIFKNVIDDNTFASLVIANYLITSLKIEDEKIYDPTPHSIFVHDNVVNETKRSKINFKNEINVVANLLFRFDPPDILYDGIRDGTYNFKKFTGAKRICLVRNLSSTGRIPSFGNMHLDSDRKIFGVPGGPVTRDIKIHDCELESLPPAVLSPPSYDPKNYPNAVLAENEACTKGLNGRVNFLAGQIADCKKLSAYGLFADPRNPLAQPNSGGFTYELNTSLFSDFALKSRFIFLPPKTTARFAKDRVYDFPIGTIIAKSFWFASERSGQKNVIETRLLIRRPQGWVALPYVWNPDHSEATLRRGGAAIELSSEWLGQDAVPGQKAFTYRVPDTNQCLNCHSLNNVMMPIGPKTKWLNCDGVGDWAHQNQISKMLENNLLTATPSQKNPAGWAREPNANDTQIPLERRARAYLDINCAHCHNPSGNAGMSGLWLESEREAQSQHTGLCKHPVAAGTAAAKLKYDIVPGKPDQSILLKRMLSERPANRMPELGRTLVHKSGIRLIEEWINGLPGECETQTK